jgi:pyruvate formate lyase activating enzyme
MLASRRGFIDGVVITGGEPTIHSHLKELIAAIRELGFTVKLDTNGYNPSILGKILTLRIVDFIAMDIKTSLRKYSRAAGVDVDTHRITKSVEMIKSSSVEYEFRITCVPGLVESEDIEEISTLIGRSGRLTLQQFHPENTLDPDYSTLTPYPGETLTAFLDIARRNVTSCRLIGV